MDIKQLARTNRGEKANTGMPCLCAFNPFVIGAALDFAMRSSEAVIIEATCNQVSQFDDYTGMHLGNFADQVRQKAKNRGLTKGQLILGGDRLEPEPWKDIPTEEAMALAKDSVKGFAQAGFTKIHLDASISCGGEPLLTAHAVVERAAQLCALIEAHPPDPDALCYIIDTEVPVPGAEASDMGDVTPTTASSLRKTIEAHRKVLHAHGLHETLEAVVFVVIQPEANFSHESILPYERLNADALTSDILAHDGLTFEAHSTDYQQDESLANLVFNHVVFLKVEPELTFASREAIVAVATIEDVMHFADPSGILNVLVQEMEGDSKSWQGRYKGDADELAFLKIYSFSDRIRCDCARPKVGLALIKLIDNLSPRPIPISLVTQYFSAPLGTGIKKDTRELIVAKFNTPSYSITRHAVPKGDQTRKSG